jgi:hypothetical protein
MKTGINADLMRGEKGELMNRIGRTIQPGEDRGGERLLSNDTSLVAV